MTLSEFKAWFEGFTEDMDGAPSARQFDKIKAKVAEIDEKPITKEVFVDRYHHYWQRPWWDQPRVTWGGIGIGPNTGETQVLSASDVTSMRSAVSAGRMDDQPSSEGFDRMAAMRLLGQAEAAA